MITINPRGMEAREWFDRTSQVLARIVPPYRLDREEEWREWGAHAIQMLQFRTQGSELPNPDNFNSWRDWAERFNEALSSID